MNIDDHFCKAAGFLGTAQANVDSHDYESAQAALASAYSHTRELLDHVQTLIVSKANVELTAGENTQ